jgi:hypothetical protein
MSRSKERAVDAAAVVGVRRYMMPYLEVDESRQSYVRERRYGIAILKIKGELVVEKHSRSKIRSSEVLA